MSLWRDYLKLTESALTYKNIARQAKEACVRFMPKTPEQTKDLYSRCVIRNILPEMSNLIRRLRDDRDDCSYAAEPLKCRDDVDEQIEQNKERVVKLLARLKKIEERLKT